MEICACSSKKRLNIAERSFLPQVTYSFSAMPIRILTDFLELDSKNRVEEKMHKNNKMLLFLLYIFLNFFICSFLAVFCLCCCKGFSLVVAIRGYSPVAMQDLLIAVASLIVEHVPSQHAASEVVRGLSSCGPGL